MHDPSTNDVRILMLKNRFHGILKDRFESRTKDQYKNLNSLFVAFSSPTLERDYILWNVGDLNFHLHINDER